MTVTEIKRKLFAILLIAALTMPVAGYAAEPDEAVKDVGEAVTDEVQEVTDAETGAENAVEVQQKLEEAAEVLEEEYAETPGEENSDGGSVMEAQAIREDEDEIPNINVIVKGGVNFITATWDEVKDADHYMVFLDDQETGVKVAADADTPRRRMFSVDRSGSHKVIVRAYRVRKAEADNESAKEEDPGTTPDPEVPEDELLAEGSAENPCVVRPMLGDGNRAILNCGAADFGVELRTILGEGNGGYAVAQGAATDGVYGYFLMVSAVTQKGRLIKMGLNDKEVIGKGPILDINHGNGMTYDSKRKALVINQRESEKNELVYVDPDTLDLKRDIGDNGKRNITYPYAFIDKNGKSDNYKSGIAAIAYISQYDIYLARSRDPGNKGVLNDLWCINAETLEAIGHIYTRVCSDYPGLYQSMAADERYAYFLLSPEGRQSGNIILALDWNSENLLPVINGEKKYIENIWSCNDNGSGSPDAVITIPISHESEGLFLIQDKDTGNAHFYVSEYYGRQHYKTVTKTKKIKKKWKKVRKWYNKKTKKWTTKKPPKKYRGKSKKVWKYKTKKVKYKAKVADYWARSDYVYDLGTF